MKSYYHCKHGAELLHGCDSCRKEQSERKQLAHKRAFVEQATIAIYTIPQGAYSEPNGGRQAVIAACGLWEAIEAEFKDE